MAPPPAVCSSGTSGSGDRSIGSPAAARQGQPEARALPRLAPGLQPAVVQPRVLERDRQAQAGAAGGAGPRRVGPPEPVEDQAGLARAQADAVVPDRHRDRASSLTPNETVDRAPLAVLDGVDERGCAGSARPGGGPPRPCSGSPGSWTTTSLPRRSARVAVDSTTRAAIGAQVGGLDVEGRRPGVEPADLEQVGQQRLEPVELGVQQLGRPRHRGVEVAARVVDAGRRPSGSSSAGCAARGRRRRRTAAARARGSPAGGSGAAGCRPCR